MIEIEHVERAFGQEAGETRHLPVLQDVDLAVRDGTFVSIVGPSGCGKTTLLRIVHGLIQPTSGRVSIDGLEVRGPDRDRAVVFQEANLLPWRTVRQNVELGLEIRGHSRADRQERARGALGAVGLEGFDDYYPHELSGGMKQLVGLARALAGDPRYLLMDEPFASLDLQLREMLQLQLLRVWEQDRKTVLFVTHSIDEAVFLSDRVVVLSARPARVLDVIDIRLPRPRAHDAEDFRNSAEFMAYRQRISRLLRREMAGQLGPAIGAGLVSGHAIARDAGSDSSRLSPAGAGAIASSRFGRFHWPRGTGGAGASGSRRGRPWR